MTPEPEVFTCEAGICKRAAEGGSEDFRVITSDLDHLMVKGLHYHLHCAPPAVQTDKRQQFIAEPEPPAEGAAAIEELIARVTRYVEEAPQIEREPMLYRAHVLGVLHQAKAMERIAVYLESLAMTTDQIGDAVSSLCAELVKPEDSQGTGAPRLPVVGHYHDFMPHTGGGKGCYMCGLPFDHIRHGTEARPDASPAEGMRIRQCCKWCGLTPGQVNDLAGVLCDCNPSGPNCLHEMSGIVAPTATGPDAEPDPAEGMRVHRFMPFTLQGRNGKDCAICLNPEDHPRHAVKNTATGPDAEPDPAEGMRRVEGGE